MLGCGPRRTTKRAAFADMLEVAFAGILEVAFAGIFEVAPFEDTLDVAMDRFPVSAERLEKEDMNKGDRTIARKLNAGSK